MQSVGIFTSGILFKIFTPLAPLLIEISLPLLSATKLKSTRLPPIYSYFGEPFAGFSTFFLVLPVVFTLTFILTSLSCAFTLSMLSFISAEFCKLRNSRTPSIILVALKLKE